MQIPNVLDEPAPYSVHYLRWYNTSVSTWRAVLHAMRKGHETGEWPNPMPPELRRLDALIGLTIGLALRQAGLAAQHGWPVRVEH